MSSSMSVTDAAGAVVRKLSDLDRRELLAGLGRLSEQDLTWDERMFELQARVNFLMADGPSQDVLDALGAHVLAMKIALAAAEEVDVSSGDEAT